MSLAVGIALEISPMGGDGKLISISHCDTAVNPNPEDWEAEFLLAELLFDRLIDDVKRETHERFAEYRKAMENVERNA